VKRILFIHIPKAGGTTLNSIISENVPSQERYATRYMWKGNPDFNNLSHTEKRKIYFLHGHMPFGFHSQLGTEEFTYITVVREPIERVLSAHNNILKDTTHFLHKEFVENRLTIPEIHEKKIWSALDNCQVRMLSNSIQAPYGTIARENFEEAIRNIDQYFSLTGYQEKLDEFVVLLCGMMNWPAPVYRKRHQSLNRITASDSDRNTIEVIREMNEWDIKLFNEVKRRFDVKIAEEGDRLIQDLNAYRANINLINRIKDYFSNKD